MSETQHIYFCSDNKYLPYSAVTMASILNNSSPSSIQHFHIIGNDISSISKEKVNQLKSIKSCEIEYLEIDDSIFDDFKHKIDMGYLSFACFYRFLIPSLAPKDITKVLYLDGDMLITAPLDDLFATDISGYKSAVVEELGAIQVQNLSLKSGKYFNSGMMLLNLKEINQSTFLNDALDYFTKNHHNITCHDQDILNGLWDEKVKFISDKYNAVSFNKTVKNPIIVHFTGFMKKPWQYYAKHKYKRLWQSHQDLTAYRLTPLSKIVFNLKSFAFKLFSIIKDPTHKKYYIAHILGIKFGLGKKDDKRK